LALLNQLPVDGFGWIVRDGAEREGICGEYPTFALWMTAEVEAALLAFERQGYFGASQVALLAQMLREAIEQVGSESATLAALLIAVARSGRRVARAAEMLEIDRQLIMRALGGFNPLYLSSL
jgi:hypothetical protein